jgi:hypothetical protein
MAAGAGGDELALKRRIPVLGIKLAKRGGAVIKKKHSGRFVIIYNGEIYNHQQIRDELAGRVPASAMRRMRALRPSPDCDCLGRSFSRIATPAL